MILLFITDKVNTKYIVRMKIIYEFNKQLIFF